MKHQRRRAALLTALLLAIATAGCGDDSDGSESNVPPTAVARVGDTLISKKQANALLPAAARQGNYRLQGARLLVLAEWLERDAKREQVSVPAEASATAGDEKSLATFTKITALSQALTEDAGGGASPEEEIARYYREHPNEYARPEVRYMRSVATDSRAQAEAAKRALERGDGWKSVIARYSTDDRSVSPPSGNMGLQPSEFDEALGSAVYAARRETFNGPVQTDQAWYVFELTHVDRLPPQSLAKVREHLKGRLQAIRLKEAQRIVGERLRDRYRPITLCSENMRLELCRNGPPLDAASVLSLGA